jgi:lysophospholipase L1-like esterase
MPGFSFLRDEVAMRSRIDVGNPPTPPPPPPPAIAINKIVIAGDSITSTTPDQPGFTSSFYSYQWKLANPSKTVNVRAQASRTVGGPVWAGPPVEGADTGSPAGNTMLDNRPEILSTYVPDLVTVMIGANDLGTFSVANYLSRLITWAAPIRAAGIKIAYSPPTPYRNGSTLHPNYTIFTNRRTELLSTLRDPAVWGQFADYYIPMGEHPDFNDAALIPSLYADNVHPSGYDAVPVGSGGQLRLYTCFNAAIRTLIDSARTYSTTVYADVWPVSETSLAANADIVRRIVISGLSPATPRTMSVLGAEISRDGGVTWVTSLARIYNGDVVDVRKTSSAVGSTAVTYDITIGTETRTISLTTVAAVAPVAYVHGAAISSGPSSTVVSFPALAMEMGVNIFTLSCFSSAGGTVNSVPPSLTLTPAGGGTAVTATLAHSGGRAASRALAFYVAQVPTTGTYNLTGTRPNAARANVMTYGLLSNADPMPVQLVAFNAPASEADPHLTGAATIPARGMAIAALLKENGNIGSMNVPATLIADLQITDTGSTAGLLVGFSTTSGAISMNNGFGTLGRGALVFKALGA